MSTFLEADMLRREQIRAVAAGYSALLDRMSAGEQLHPERGEWKDSRFQRMVVERLTHLKSLTANADKWEAVKELFREAGRGNG